MTTATTIATWNPQRIEQLRNCVGAGLTCSQIAAEIGVTRNAVIGKIHRLGLSPGRPPAGPGRAPAPRLRQSLPATQGQLLRLIQAEATSIGDQTNAAGLAVVDSPQRCSLLELAQSKCRWPISEPGAADFDFCGNEAIKGFSYCAGHARMAYRPASRRRA